jgi:two-component system, NarL family, response regulator NreC
MASTIVIADDHAVVRSGLRLLLDAEPDLEVVAEAGTVPDALQLVRAHRPAVAVLDLNMPGGSSLEAITELGALGYALKEAADEELLQAVHLAVSGEIYLNPRLGARLAMAPAEPAGPPDDLTEREVEILRLIALGHANAEIAGQLYLSVRTVETHRAHIQQKLSRTTRAELVRYALDRGLIGT